MLTSAKLLTGYLVVGITRELDKESLLNQSLIYTEYTQSMLYPHVCLISYSRPPVIVQEYGQTLDQGQGQDSGNYQSTTDIELGDRHMTWKSCDRLEQSRAVWKDLGSRRIRKSLELELGLEDDVKRQGFLMVHTWCMHVQWR